MNIAIIDPGSYTLPYNCFLSRGLIQSGHKVTIFCSETQYNEGLINELESMYPDDVQINRFLISRSRTNNIIKSLFGYIKLIAKSIILRRDFDLVMIQFGVFLPLDIFLYSVFHCRLALTIHDDVPHGFTSRRHWPTLVRCFFADILIFPSEAVKSRFASRYPFPSIVAKSVLLQHGVLAAKLATSPSTIITRSALPIRLTFFGTVKPYKGVENLIELVSSGHVTTIDIFGKWSSELSSLRMTAIANGITVVDEYLQPEAVDLLLRESRIFVLPYNSASQSGVLYLLLYYARPFVCSDSADLSAFLRMAGLTALISEDNSPASFARCISHAIDNYEEVRAVLAQVREKYDWSTIIQSSSIFETA